MNHVIGSLLTIYIALTVATASAEDVRFPPGVGIIDVTAAPYHATGDGKTDDRAAIQRAIDDAMNQWRVIYFPSGTYRVGGTLSYGADKSRARLVVLQGQGMQRTAIRLADRCAGFGDPRKPKCLLTMFEGPSTGEAFNNAIRNITFDVGSGNPGAIGVQWMNNNAGCMRHVTIRSSDPSESGAIGLDLTRTEPGPGLVKNVLIEGFDVGVEAVPGPFSMTFEHLSLRGQRLAGIRNKWHTFTIRDLQSVNDAPAIIQSEPSGMTVLLDSKLFRQTSDARAFPLLSPKLTRPSHDEGSAAIENRGLLILRNVQQSGYTRIVRDGGNAAADLDGETVDEYVSSRPHPNAQSAEPTTRPTTLGLPVVETPEIPWDAPEQWVVIDAAALKEAADDTIVIQGAFDRAAREHKTTVCFPGGLKEGEIRFGGTIRVSGSVRRVIGMDGPWTLTDALRESDKPMFRVEEISGEAILFERFSIVNWAKGSHYVWIEHATPKTLIIADAASISTWECGGSPYRAGPNAGDLFVEDSCSAEYALHEAQHCWMRQFNPETNRTAMINRGGTLWILGLKTENGAATIIETLAGGKTELLGGMNYSSWEPLKQKQPMFVVTDAAASFTIGALSFDDHRGFDTVLRETQGGVTKDLSVKEADCGGRGHAGSFLRVTAGKP